MCADGLRWPFQGQAGGHVDLGDRSGPVVDVDYQRLDAVIRDPGGEHRRAAGQRAAGPRHVRRDRAGARIRIKRSLEQGEPDRPEPGRAVQVGLGTEAIEGIVARRPGRQQLQQLIQDGRGDGRRLGTRWLRDVGGRRARVGQDRRRRDRVRAADRRGPRARPSGAGRGGGAGGLYCRVPVRRDRMLRSCIRLKRQGITRAGHRERHWEAYVRKWPKISAIQACTGHF
jgi:hypothetical protein